MMDGFVSLTALLHMYLEPAGRTSTSFLLLVPFQVVGCFETENLERMKL